MEDDNKTEVSETAEDQAPPGETEAVEATTTDKAGEETATEDHGKEEDTAASEEAAPVTESEATPGEDENVEIVTDENVDHDLKADDNIVDHALRNDDDNSADDNNVGENSNDDNNVGENSNDNNVGENSNDDHNVGENSNDDHNVGENSNDDHNVGENSNDDHNVGENSNDDHNVGENSNDDHNVGENSNDENAGDESSVQGLTTDENVVEDGNVNGVIDGNIVDGGVEGGDVDGKTGTGDQPPDQPSGEELPEEGENGENGEQPTEEEAAEVSTEDKITDGEETLSTDQITEEAGEGGEKSEEEVPEKDDGELQAVPEGDESSADEPVKPADQEASDEPPKSPIPQSDTFTEGDRQDSPVPQPVGEKLSRGPTPTLEDISREETETELLVPGTPDRQGSVTEGDVTQEAQDEDESSPEPQFDRDFLIEKYNAALAEREQVKQQNYQLQHKLAEYFRKKKSDDRADYDKNVTDQEQRYLKYMDQLQELQKQARREKENYKLQINDLEDKCKERKKKVDEERNKFTDFKQVVALNSMNSRSGKPIPPKDIEQYLINEEKKENEVVNVRLENIKSKNKLKKKEQQLKSKEELAEGLHLIDFEQLKIENQTYNEKIEERNEELLKLRKKITSTVQVLTHLKEKLQFVQAENQVQKKNLQEVEALAGQKRDILSRTKQARDSLRIDNHKLRQNCGLLGNEPLLRDFEERKDEGDDLKIQLEELRLLHAELALNCNQVRRKIEQARMGQA